ncbi:MAG: Crp/Fnr family transcriptional regulator [Parasphingorhabdus sp.]
MQSSYHLKDKSSRASSELGATGFMKGLPESVANGLVERGRSIDFAKGQMIQQRGDPGTEFWHIKSGTVQIGRFSENGDWILFAVLGEGESFGEQAFLGEFPRMVDAIASSDCEIIKIGEAELQHLLETQADAARILLKTMAYTVQQTFDLVEAGRRLSTVERLAQALARQCGSAREAEINMTQQDLADLIGVSRVSLGKALSELERKNLIVRGYGKLVVSNSDALVQLVRN